MLTEKKFEHYWFSLIENAGRNKEVKCYLTIILKSTKRENGENVKVISRTMTLAKLYGFKN